LAEGASWTLAGKLSRKIRQRRKLETSRKAGRKIDRWRRSRVDWKAERESQSETQVEDWLESWAERSVEGASWRLIGELAEESGSR